MGYTPNYSHLVGIMISKTIGCRGTLFSDKLIYHYCSNLLFSMFLGAMKIVILIPLLKGNPFVDQ